MHNPNYCDMAGMMRQGGLFLVPPGQILGVKGQLINHAEFGGFGQVWVCPADGRIPDYLSHPVWPTEHLADPDRRKDMDNPDLIRVTLRQPERISMILSLQPQREALVSARSLGAGAVLLDGLQEDLETCLAIIDAVEKGPLVIAATSRPLINPLFGSEAAPDHVCDPDGVYLPPDRVPRDAAFDFWIKWIETCLGELQALVQ